MTHLAGQRQELGLRAFLTDRRVAGHAGRDGGHLVPAGLRLLRQYDLHAADPGPDLAARLDHDQIALQLAIFVVAAVPGYVLAIAWLDRIGHRRLQWTGFAVMALCFLIIAAVPGLATMVRRSCWCTG